MNRLDHAIYEMNKLHSLASRDQWVNNLHPLVKLLLTLVYIGGVMWLPGYALDKVLLAAVYPFAVLIFADIPVASSIYRIRWILVLFGVMGAANLFFDRQPWVQIGGIWLTGGMLAFAVMVFKGMLCALAGYCLVAATTIDSLCYALRLIRIPSVLIVQIQLTYRYISLLLAEANRMEQAYALRAPGQKGIHYKVWGSLLGQLLLRSMDRAKKVYESMLLRGFDGTFYYDNSRNSRKNRGEKR